MNRQALSYLRVSSRGQVDGHGLDRQRETIGACARKMRLRIVQEFADDVSGTLPLAERPGLSSLLDRILSNGVRTIFVERADRLSRDLVVGELILAEFRRHGVKVIEADGGNVLTESNTPTAALVRQVLGAVSEFSKAELVAKMRRAREAKKAATGKRVEGGMPYGLKPGEREVVDLIFKLRRKGPGKRRRTLQQIADELERRKIPTRTGTRWSTATVYVILKRDPDKLDAAPRRRNESA